MPCIHKVDFNGNPKKGSSICFANISLHCQNYQDLKDIFNKHWKKIFSPQKKNPQTTLLPSTSQPISTINVIKLQELIITSVGLMRIHGSSLYQFVTIKKINLSHNSLRSLPPEIKLLAQLTYANFNHNYLKKLPDEIGQLRNLEFLHVNYNSLSQIPESITQLKELQLFSCNDNCLPVSECLKLFLNLRRAEITVNYENNPLDIVCDNAHIHRNLPQYQFLNQTFPSLDN